MNFPYNPEIPKIDDPIDGYKSELYNRKIDFVQNFNPNDASVKKVQFTDIIPLTIDDNRVILNDNVVTVILPSDITGSIEVNKFYIGTSSTPLFINYIATFEEFEAPAPGEAVYVQADDRLRFVLFLNANVLSLGADGLIQNLRMDYFGSESSLSANDYNIINDFVKSGYFTQVWRAINLANDKVGDIDPDNPISDRLDILEYKTTNTYETVKTSDDDPRSGFTKISGDIYLSNKLDVPLLNVTEQTKLTGYIEFDGNKNENLSSNTSVIGENKYTINENTETIDTNTVEILVKDEYSSPLVVKNITNNIETIEDNTSTIINNIEKINNSTVEVLDSSKFSSPNDENTITLQKNIIQTQNNTFNYRNIIINEKDEYSSPLVESNIISLSENVGTKIYTNTVLEDNTLLKRNTNVTNTDTFTGNIVNNTITTLTNNITTQTDTIGTKSTTILENNNETINGDETKTIRGELTETIDGEVVKTFNSNISITAKNTNYGIMNVELNKLQLTSKQINFINSGDISFSNTSGSFNIESLGSILNIISSERADTISGKFTSEINGDVTVTNKSKKTETTLGADYKTIEGNGSLTVNNNYVFTSTSTGTDAYQELAINKLMKGTAVSSKLTIDYPTTEFKNVINLLNGANINGPIKTKDIIADGNVTIQGTGFGNLNVSSNTEIGGNLSVINGTTSLKTVTASDSITTNHLTAEGTTTLNGNTSIGNGAADIIKLHGQVESLGNIENSGNFTNGGSILNNGNINNELNITNGGTITSSGTITTNGALDVTGGNVSVTNGNLNILNSGNANISGNMNVSGTTSLSGNVTVQNGSNLIVANNGNLNVSGTGNVSGNFDVSGNFSVGGTLSVTGQFILDNIIANTTLTSNGTSSFVGASSFTGKVSANAFDAIGVVNLGDVSNATNVKGDLNVTGATTINTLNNTGNTILGTNTSNSHTINGSANITNKLTVGGTSTFAEASTFNGILYAYQQVYMNGANIFVSNANGRIIKGTNPSPGAKEFFNSDNIYNPSGLNSVPNGISTLVRTLTTVTTAVQTINIGIAATRVINVLPLTSSFNFEYVTYTDASGNLVIDYQSSGGSISNVVVRINYI